MLNFGLGFGDMADPLAERLKLLQTMRPDAFLGLLQQQGASPALATGPMPAAPATTGSIAPPAPSGDDEEDAPAPAKPALGLLNAPPLPPARPADMPAPNAAPMALPGASPPVAAPTAPGDGFSMDKLMRGLSDNSDMLIGLGSGLMSGRNWGEGLSKGFEQAQKGAALAATTKLANAKAQKELLGQNATYNYLIGKGLSPTDAMAGMASKDVLQELMKPGAVVEVAGKKYWLKAGQTPDQGTLLGDAKGEEPDKASRPLTDPTERLKYGIGPDDTKPYQIDGNNKVSAISGGGQTFNIGQQNDYNTELTGALSKAHANLSSNVEASAEKMRSLNAMKGAVDRIVQNGGTTGIGQDELTKMKGAINTAANMFGMDAPNDISDPETLKKFGMQLAGAQAKAVGGSRVTNFEMQNFMQANPGLEMSTTGNQRIIGIMQQTEQRNLELGHQIRQMTADAVSSGRKVDAGQVERMIRDYDKAHPITDPITGQDLTKDPRLPEFRGQGGQGGQASGQPTKRLRFNPATGRLE